MKAKALFFYIGICAPGLSSAWKIGRIIGVLPANGAVPEPYPAKNYIDITTTPKDCTEMSVGPSRLNPKLDKATGFEAKDGGKKKGIVSFQGVQIRQGNAAKNPLSEVKYIALWVNKNCESVPQAIIHFWQDYPGAFQDINFAILGTALKVHDHPFDLEKMGWWSWGEVQPLEDGTDRFPWVPEGGVAWRVSKALRSRDRYGIYVVVPNVIKVGNFVTIPGVGAEKDKTTWVTEDSSRGTAWSTGSLHDYILPEFDNGLIAVPKHQHEVGVGEKATMEEKLAKSEANRRSRESVRIVGTGAFIGDQAAALLMAKETQRIKAAARTKKLAGANANAGAGGDADANSDLPGQAESGDGRDTDQIATPPSSDVVVEPSGFITSLYESGAADLLRQAQIAKNQLSYEFQQLSKDQMADLQMDQVSLLPPIQLVDLLYFTRVRRELIDAGYDYDTAMATLQQGLLNLRDERDWPSDGNAADFVSQYTYELESEHTAPDQLGPDEIQRMQEFEEILKKEEDGQMKTEEGQVKTEEGQAKIEEGQAKIEEEEEEEEEEI
ncbi:hypothetical protein TWF106_006859 [Orbilia oligospora]|uniref:Uncharacterized protein n=1 Tax=Orbilia oligospora TaxID=2813651 RepID=A0A7C8QR01_ORBOL|nr:hypothetical protein TWF106_006859 [Orbilia oligospora]